MINNNTDTTIYYGKCGGTPLFAHSKFIDGNWGMSGFWGSPCLAIYLWETENVPTYSTAFDSLYVTSTGIYKFLLLYGWNSANSISDTLVSHGFEVVD